MIVLVITLALAQDVSCRGAAADAMRSAARLAEEFDLARAAAGFEQAAALGCADAEVPAVYARALIAAKEAYRHGGDAESLAPVRAAAATLERRAASRPGIAEIARLVLMAAAAAAQSERDEMALFLEQAIRVEKLQLVAAQPAAPVIAAHEAAGDLWFQVHRYEDARAAYVQAAQQLGATPRVTLGLARAAARQNDSATACAEYRTLMTWWGARPGTPTEITEARAYLGGSCR